MFTGIVAAIGHIVRVQPLGHAEAGLRLEIDAGNLDLSDVALGDSIAVQGACMTVIAKEGARFQVDVSRASLGLTVGLDRVAEVNLEKALRVGDPLGGHLVSGHVDGLGLVESCQPVGESHQLCLRLPSTLARFMAYKGSVAVNGVSLTVNQVSDKPGDHAHDSVITINLIPHTLHATTLKHLRAGDQVNIEVDTIARYVARMLAAGGSAASVCP